MKRFLIFAKAIEIKYIRSIMGAVELKNLITDYVANADMKLLRIIKAVCESYESNDTESATVAYTASGDPLTKEMYIQKVKDADKAMDQGKFVSSEEVKRQILSW